MLFLIALAGIVTSAVRVVSANKWVESLRTAAEAGVEYALSQYNSVYPCPLDPPPGVASVTTAVPAAYLQLGNANPGVTGVTVSVKVSQLIAGANWTNLQQISSIYSPQLDPTRSTSKSFALPAATNVTTGGYRIIESTATNGVYSRTIRVIIKARFDMPPNGIPVTTGTTSTQNYFNYPLFSNGALSFAPSGGLLVSGFNSLEPAAANLYLTTPPVGVPYNSYNLNVATNTSATIGPGVTVAGDVSVFSNDSGTTPVAYIPGGVNPGSGTIDGRLTTNGIPDPTTVIASPGTTPNGNVLANADIPPTNPSAPRLNINATDPAAPESTVPQNQIAPVPESVSGQPLPSLVSSPQNPSPVVPSGSYTTEGLSTANLSTPVVFQNSSQPISLYVNDAGSSPQAVNIDTSMLATQNTNTTARNLQIYYEGSEPVNVNVSGSNPFNALIYAPNAPVTISGNGTYNGGIVGGSVTVTMSGAMNLYTDLAINNGSTPPFTGTGSTGFSKSDLQTAFNANQSAGLQYQQGPNGSIITGWQPVTWQEFTPAPP